MVWVEVVVSQGRWENQIQAPIRGGQISWTWLGLYVGVRGRSEMILPIYC